MKIFYEKNTKYCGFKGVSWILSQKLTSFFVKYRQKTLLKKFDFFQAYEYNLQGHKARITVAVLGEP